MNAKIVLVTMDSVLTNLLNMSVSVIQALISPPTVGMVYVTLFILIKNFTFKVFLLVNMTIGHLFTCFLFLIPESNECLSNPCVNGTCNDLLNMFNCSCEDGFNGTLCDHG